MNQIGCSTKKKMVMSAWVGTNVSIFPFFISVCVATGVVSAEGHGGVGFSLIYTFIHNIVLLVFGTYTLTKSLTPVTYGMLSAACLMMGSWMLQTCIVIGQYNCVVDVNQTATGFSDCLTRSSNPGAIRSTIAFGVFLFLGYIITGVLLVLYKNNILSKDVDHGRFLDEESGTSGDADPADFAPVQNTSVPKYMVEEDDDDESSDEEGAIPPVQAASL